MLVLHGMRFSQTYFFVMKGLACSAVRTHFAALQNVTVNAWHDIYLNLLVGSGFGYAQHVLL